MTHYFEILYSDCFLKKYVALQATEKTIPEIAHINGLKIIDYKETTFDAYRKNEIKTFKDYSFSIK